MPLPTKGFSTVVFADGYDLTRYLNEITLPGEAAKLDNTMFGNAGYEETVPGLNTGSLSMGGIHTGTANDANAIMRAAFGQEEMILLVGLAGSTLGSPAFLARLQEHEYEVQGGYADLVKITAGGKYSNRFDWGLFLHAKGTEAASGSSASIDNAAASANGWAAVLQIFDVPGGDPDASEVIIEHSTNTSTWVELHSFDPQIETVADHAEGTGTVHRYVRATWVNEAGVSNQFALGFARR